jgi:hypothetical protein
MPYTIDPSEYASSVGHSGIDLDDAVEGYLDAQLWAQHDSESDECLDANYNRSDIADDYVASVRAELEGFVAQHPLAVRMYLTQRNTSGYTADSAFGHDFYLTREHHGAGFWDRGLGELGNYLTELCEPYGDATELYDGGSGTLVGA